MARLYSLKVVRIRRIAAFSTIRADRRDVLLDLVNAKARDPSLGLRAEAMNILPDAKDPKANDTHSASEFVSSIRVRRTPYRLTPDAKAADYHERCHMRHSKLTHLTKMATTKANRCPDSIVRAWGLLGVRRHLWMAMQGCMPEAGGSSALERQPACHC
jgi:hypothetical protein